MEPPPDPTALRVTVTASPASPLVDQAVTLSAAIANAPEDESPSYDWQIDLGGEWMTWGRNATFSFKEGQPVSWDFRVAVSYDSGPSATSDPITVTWTSPYPKSPANLVVIVPVPGGLQLLATWDAVEDADSYRLSWRRPNGGFEAGNTAAVTDNHASIAVEGYGWWVVRVESCNDAGCGVGAEQTAGITPGIRDQPGNQSPTERSGRLGRLGRGGGRHLVQAELAAGRAASSRRATPSPSRAPAPPSRCPAPATGWPGWRRATTPAAAPPSPRASSCRVPRRIRMMRATCTW